MYGESEPGESEPGAYHNVSALRRNMDTPRMDTLIKDVTW